MTPTNVFRMYLIYGFGYTKIHSWLRLTASDHSVIKIVVYFYALKLYWLSYTFPFQGLTLQKWDFCFKEISDNSYSSGSL